MILAIITITRAKEPAIGEKAVAIGLMGYNGAELRKKEGVIYANRIYETTGFYFK